MLRIATLALVATTLSAASGCGDGESPRLPAGGHAVAADPQGSHVEFYVYHTGDATGTPAAETVSIPSGTRVLVVNDDGPGSGYRKGRMVEVRVEDGERRGLVGFVPRPQLRPK